MPALAEVLGGPLKESPCAKEPAAAKGEAAPKGTGQQRPREALGLAAARGAAWGFGPKSSQTSFASFKRCRSQRITVASVGITRNTMLYRV